jgi:hypothetical protein
MTVAFLLEPIYEFDRKTAKPSSPHCGGDDDVETDFFAVRSYAY